jgi:hypothetical protein
VSLLLSSIYPVNRQWLLSGGNNMFIKELKTNVGRNNQKHPVRIE